MKVLVRLRILCLSALALSLPGDGIGRTNERKSNFYGIFLIGAKGHYGPQWKDTNFSAIKNDRLGTFLGLKIVPLPDPIRY